ncbi:MAG TPA: DinB family protein [Candidatus Dormibacteraeota bacterium]|nr:DinB family protein [Candidatus Dormibacteraeota bacterium]
MPPHAIDFYSGWAKHNELLVRALSPLDEKQLEWTPGANLWPVRRLANHIVAARAWWFGGWMGEDPDTLTPLIDYDDESGADERDAATICQALDASWKSLESSLGKWTDADLDQQFQRPRPNQMGQRPWWSRRGIVWHVAEHDVHHGGEISLILGMHGGRGLDL